MLLALNNHLILEKYKTDGSIQTEIRNGFAFTKQKTAVKGLRVLVATELDGRQIPKGATAYIREEDLHNKEWAKKILSCDAISEEFIVVDMKDILFIKAIAEEA